MRRIQRVLEIHAALQNVNKPNAGASASAGKQGSRKKVRTSPTSHFALSRAIALVALCGNTYDEPVETADALAFFKLALDVEGFKYLKTSGPSKLTSVAGGHIHALYNRWKEWCNDKSSTRGRFSLQEQFNNLVKSAAPARGASKRRRRAIPSSSEDDIGGGSSDDDESGDDAGKRPRAGAAPRGTRSSRLMVGVPGGQAPKRSTTAGKSESQMSHVARAAGAAGGAGAASAASAELRNWKESDSDSNSDESVGDSNSGSDDDEE